MPFAIARASLNGSDLEGARGYLIDPGEEIDSEGHDGDLYQRGHHILRANRTAELSTYDLHGVLGALTGSSDVPLVELDAANGLQLYGQPHASGDVGYGSTARLRQALRGVVHATGITWSEGSLAELSLGAQLISADGTTDPVSDTTGTTPSPAATKHGFTLSALTVRGSSVTDVASVELTIDAKIGPDHTRGLPYPTGWRGAGVNGPLDVSLSVETAEMDITPGSGAVSLVFTNYAHGGGLGAVTVTLTLNGAWTFDEQWQGTHGEAMTRRLVVKTRHDGANRPLTWTLSV